MGVLQKVDDGNTLAEVTKDYQRSKGTIGNIDQKHDSCESSNSAGSSKRLKKGNFPDVEKALVERFNDCNQFQSRERYCLKKLKNQQLIYMLKILRLVVVD